MVSSGSRFLPFVALAAMLSAVPASAQNGRISGTVKDAHGGALSGATVRAANQATGASRRATSGADGSYTVADVAAGAYTVTASLPGLRPVTQRDVQVAAGGSASVDFTLQPQVLEAITVTAMLREQELAAVPFSIAAPTEKALRLRGAENIEQIAANVAGFSVQNLGPGQSQIAMRGASSGQIARDQPGVKEEGGWSVSGRRRHLPVPVHTGPGPVRRRSRGSAARSSGNVVRLGLTRRHRALHHQSARARRVQDVR